MCSGMKFLGIKVVGHEVMRCTVEGMVFWVLFF